MLLHSQNNAPDPIENFLEAIEVEWYYETMLKRKQIQKGVEKFYPLNWPKMVKNKDFVSLTKLSYMRH